MTNSFTSVQIQNTLFPQADWEPDAEEQAQIERHERTRAERWSALTSEEQDAVIEASEAEYAHRYDRGYR